MLGFLGPDTCRILSFSTFLLTTCCRRCRPSEPLRTRRSLLRPEPATLTSYDTRSTAFTWNSLSSHFSAAVVAASERRTIPSRFPLRYCDSRAD
jgi:hypothetical protein